MEAHRTIANGPEKFDISAALFSRGLDGDRQVIIFKVEKENCKRLGLDEQKQCDDIGVIVNSAEREDSSGGSWILKGFLRSRTQEIQGSVIHTGSREHPFEAHFNTTTRKGWMQF